MVISHIIGDAVHAKKPLVVQLYHDVFPDIAAPNYVEQRMPLIQDPVLHLAHDDIGHMLGFKLAYRRGPTLLFSWLGGVLPTARRKGVARALMTAQHEWAKSEGYTHVETNTRSTNNPMITANLSNGFHIVGMESKGTHLMIVQRKSLSQRQQ